MAQRINFEPEIEFTPDEEEIQFFPDEDESVSRERESLITREREEPPSAERFIKGALGKAKDWGGKALDWGTTSLVPGLDEPSIEEWVEDPKGSAIDSLGMAVTTPLGIIGELGGAAWAGLRGLRRFRGLSKGISEVDDVAKLADDIPSPNRMGDEFTEEIFDESGRSLVPPRRISPNRPPGPWEENPGNLDFFKENSLNINDGTFTNKAGQVVDKPVTSPIDKLTAALAESKPLSRQQREILTAERAEKIAKAKDVDIVDESSANKFLGRLKGEHTRISNTPLELDQDDVTELYKTVGNYPHRDGFRKGRGIVGLKKLLEGEVLQQNEIELLEEIFNITIPKRNGPGLVRRLISGTTNNSRAMTAALDLPGFRQALPGITTKAWWTSWDDAIKSYGSREAFDGVMKEIQEDKLYGFISDTMGVDITDTLRVREETFARANLARHIPLIKGSERGHVAYLNKFRMDLAKSLVNDQIKAALQPGLSPAESRLLDPYRNKVLAKKLGDFVNDMSGRGNLGRIEKYAGELNEVMFSPRLQAARVRMIGRYLNLATPEKYSSVPKAVRKATLKSLIGVSGTILTLNGLADAAGFDVTQDSNSPDFGKIKLGNTRIDPGGAFLQYVVAVSRLISGLSTSSVSGRQEELGEGFRATTRKDIGERFGISKVNPVVGFAYDLLNASQNRPVNLADRTVRLYIPFLIQDINEISQEDPTLLPMLLPSLGGMGAQTYGGDREATIVPEEFDFQFEGGSPFD